MLERDYLRRDLGDCLVRRYLQNFLNNSYFLRKFSDSDERMNDASIEITQEFHEFYKTQSLFPIDHKKSISNHTYIRLRNMRLPLKLSFNFLNQPCKVSGFKVAFQRRKQVVDFEESLLIIFQEN